MSLSVSLYKTCWHADFIGNESYTLADIIAAMVLLLALMCLTIRILGLFSSLTLLGARMQADMIVDKLQN